MSEAAPPTLTCPCGETARLVVRLSLSMAGREKAVERRLCRVCYRNNCSAMEEVGGRVNVLSIARE